MRYFVERVTWVIYWNFIDICSLKNLFQEEMGLAQKLLLISARHKVAPCRDNQWQQPIGYEFIYTVYIFIYYFFFFYKNTERLWSCLFLLKFSWSLYAPTCSKNSSMGLICVKTMWKYEENQTYTCRDSTLTVNVFSQQLWSYFDNSSHSNLTSFSIYTFFLLV